MKKYRITSDGRKFRIKKRFFCFWIYEKILNNYFQFVPLEFDDFASASQYVIDKLADDAQRKHFKKRKWKKVKK